MRGQGACDGDDGARGRRPRRADRSLPWAKVGGKAVFAGAAAGGSVPTHRSANSAASKEAYRSVHRGLSVSARAAAPRPFAATIPSSSAPGAAP